MSATSAIVGLGTVALLACAPVQAPHTPESERAARLRDTASYRRCPEGRPIEPIGDQVTYDPADNCADVEGIAWSSCAWNAEGFNPILRAAADARVIAGSCGLDGWPPCEPPLAWCLGAVPR